MSGPLRIQDAVPLEPSSPGGTPDYPDAGPRAVAHTTESPAGAYKGDPDFWFNRMDQVLRVKAAEPTLLYDPITDRLGEYFPLNQTGRALKNDGGRRSNRVGRVCIQIEFLGYASRPFTRNWTPGPNFDRMIDAIRRWGVPDLWPSGLPPAYPDGTDERSRDIWYTKAGWYGHSQVPGNDHGDPGAISVPEFFRQAKSPADDPGAYGSRVWPAWCRYPGRAGLGAGRGNDAPVNLLIKSALIIHGHRTGFTGTIDANWDKNTDARLAEFKSDFGIDEDGIGRSTWAALGRMRDEAPDFPGLKPFVLGKSSPTSLDAQALLALQGFAGVLGGVLTREWRPKAVRAVRRFQLSEPRLKADPDGEWGPLTWKLAWTDND